MFNISIPVDSLISAQKIHIGCLFYKHHLVLILWKEMKAGWGSQENAAFPWQRRFWNHLCCHHWRCFCSACQGPSDIHLIRSASISVAPLTARSMRSSTKCTTPSASVIVTSFRRPARRSRSNIPATKIFTFRRLWEWSWTTHFAPRLISPRSP